MTDLRARLAAAVLAGALAPLGGAQGISYLNFETPQLKPIACTTAGGRSFLLVCNAPDNSLEVYAISSPAAPVFVARVPVGLEPVTVAVKPTLLAGNVRRCYVANWLGDSITIVDLHLAGGINAVRTERVGDEPVGIAFHPADESLVVTFSAQASWGWFDGTMLQPMQANSQFIELFDALPQTQRSIKDPRAIAVSPPTAVAPNVAGALCILNHRGGNNAAFDYDLWSTSDVATSAATQKASLPDLGGLGSTNFNMAFAPNGDLFVVAQHARNKELANFVEDLGEAVARGMVTGSTGFVTSQLVRVRGIGSATPVVDPPLDLNSATTYQGTQAALAITQPTDVVVKGPGGGSRIFVTGFASDSLGMVALSGGGFSLTRVDLGAANKFTSANLGGVMRGPRGLALNAAQDRLYVYNRNEHSVTVVDADATPPAVLTTFPLQADPTPAYIKNGRKFLYSSQLSGGNNVACAACHIDGNSDFLAWNLSDGVHVPASPNPTTGGDPLGVLGPNTALDPASSIPDRKGPMQVQSLRGLVNFEVADDAVQDGFFSNKPYHWRGDRATFQDFNGAFVNLMAIANPFAADLGIPPAQMTEYREFINSVHYPPNPEQPAARVYSGSMTTPNPDGAADPLNNANAGEGAAWGLKVFHIVNSDGRACVHCHGLADGSNNRFTEAFAHVSSNLDINRIETTALRGLVLKEAELWRLITSGPLAGFVAPVNQTFPAFATGEFGLTHTGKSTLVPTVGGTVAIPFGSRSISDFVDAFVLTIPQINATTRYMREFDTGVAPSIGRVLTVTSASSLPAVNATLDELETQAERANAALAVTARLGAVARGFWYDVAQHATMPYVEEPHTGVAPLPPMDRGTLLGLVTNASDRMTFHAVPLGSARRVAFLDGGTPPALPSGAPTAIQLRGCRPNTANALVPAFTANWFRFFQQGGFDSALADNVGNNKSMIYYQASLRFHAATATPASFGLADFRHEPPRRFVVTGTGIREGAWLRIFLPTAADWATATATTPPTTTPTVVTNPNPIELPLFSAVDPATDTVEWQTAAEIEPYHLLALMNGGPNSSAVQQAITAPDSLDLLVPPIIPPAGGGPTQNFFLPEARNWHFVQVINNIGSPATTTSTGSWRRLTLQ